MDRRSKNESSEDRLSTSSVRREEAKPIKIDGHGTTRIFSVAFLADGKHIVSGGDEQKIRRWRVEDGKEVGTPMNERSNVFDIATTLDGKWIVNGTRGGHVTVWNADSHEKVIGFQAHKGWVYGVDVSPDGTRIATGSYDNTASVWSLSTGERLLGPLEHSNTVIAVKFSPDGRLIATATWYRESVRIYDSQDGRLLVGVPIRVNSPYNQSLAWASDSNQLFALSENSQIHCLDVSTGKTLSKWPIHTDKGRRCIALASNGTFIAASSASSVSFWDATTHNQIGSVIEHPATVDSMAVSVNHDIVVAGGKTITIQSLRNILPPPYFDNQASRASVEKTPVEDSSHSKFTHLEKTVREHRSELITSHQTAKKDKDSLNETINTLRADLRALAEGSNSKIEHLEKTVQDLRDELATSQRVASEQEDSLNKIIESLEKTVQQLRTQLTESEQKAEERDNLLRVHDQKHRCESLYAAGRTFDAALSLVEITNTMSEEVRANKLLMDWLAEFTNRCSSRLEEIGDDALNVEQYDEALAAYSAVLSLGPSTPNNVLFNWARTMMNRGSANKALDAAIKFKLPRFMIYRAICDALERDGRITEAITCFRQMQSELAEDMSIPNEQSQWELSFQRRCAEQLEKLADVAMDAQDYSKAAKHLSTILSLDGVDRMDTLIKRSKARTLMGSWGDALSDADEAIKLNPSSHQGYERRHAALHGARRHGEAVEAFDTMLLKLKQSPHEHVRKLLSQYIDARPTIRRIINETLRDMPRILIDTPTGRLYDKQKQLAAFEALPIWDELISSMTRKVDYARIRNAVKECYRYVMLSHTWEHDEPLLQKVKDISIYDLESSPTNIKLQRFCSLVHFLGFRWAWADTTCVDQENNVVLQESLVAMFTWYRASFLTLVYLRGVSSESRLPGGLQGSIWNTRGWTYQEYVAAETVQFYTEDWKPYLGLDLANHKVSPVIISEMQQATGISAAEMAVLRPGLGRVREKLYVASMRQTTRMEDIAYSLLGIFNVSIPVIYGEGDRAVGRLLEHILTGSGDVTIVAWTGRAGSYNSCLPVNLTVYNQLVPPHIPRPIEMVEMDSMVMALRSSLPDLSLAMALHNQLNALPSPSLAASRLRLPGIAFPLGELVHTSEPDPETNLDVYHATTSLFGDIEIKTADDLTGMGDLCLVHPWIRPLLDQEFSRRVAAFDEMTQALRLIARLRQPFGALLLEPVSRVEYRRVAADSLIMIQFSEEISLTELIKNVRTFEIQ